MTHHRTRAFVRRMATTAIALLLALPIAACLPTRPLGAQAVRRPPTDTGSRWDAFGSLRVRGEAWNWFDATARGEYAFGAATLRLGVERQVRRQAWVLEVEAPLLVGLPDDAVVTAPEPGTFGPGAGELGLGGTYSAANFGDGNAAQLFPKQLHWRLTRRQLRATSTLRVGRFEYDEGLETQPASATLAALKQQRIASRLIGSFAWTHVGRSLDGVHWSTKQDGRDATLLVAAPTRGVFQADGWAPLPIAIAYGAWTVPYSTARGSADARLFGIQYVDLRDDPVRLTANGPAQTLDDEQLAVTTIGGHWLFALERSAATIDFTLWGAGQVGTWGEQAHRAWSGVAEVGVQPRAFPSIRPWLRGGVTYGSGDRDPDDGRHGTFFQLLPTPRPYARFPFHNMQNTQDVYAILALRPSPKLTLRGEVHRVQLARAEDLWYLGGGAWQPRTFGYTGRSSGGARDLATLVDFSADLRFTPDFTLSAYLSRARAGDAMAAAYPAREAGSLVYLEVRRQF